MAVQPNHVLSHYRLIEKIGEGGMGVVWKAEDTVLGRTVAVKVLPAEVSRNEERQKMFFEEARLASSLSDAHIAQVHEFGREGDLDFIVMEYVEGKPLSKILHGRPLPPDKVVALGLQVARALSRAHRKGLIHRDLKPSNLLVTPDGELKVVDFGLATLFERRDTVAGPDEATRTTSGGADASRGTQARAGTLPYMSPEQVRGELLDARTDIFSFGVVLYEMTTGQRPFAGVTAVDLVQEITRARVKAPHELVSKLPLELERIVQKSLAARCEDRYQTMDDLAVDLKRLERELESGSSPSYDDVAKAVAGVRRRWLPWTVASAAVLVAAVAGAWWLVSGRASRLDPRRVFVLPLEVRSQAEGADYAGPAFAEALAINLAQVKSLIVLPVEDRADAATMSLSDALARAAARNAGLLLKGRLVRDGDKVDATLQLLDVGDSRILWGMEQKAENGDLSGLAASLSRQVVLSLGAVLPRVYDRPFLLTEDPDLAHAPLALEVAAAYERSDDTSALPAATKLVAAFPRSVEAHAMRAFVLLDVWDSDRSTQKMRQLDGALSSLTALDGDNPFSIMIRGYVLEAGEGKHREAIDALTTVISRSDLGPSLRAWALRYRANSETQLGNQVAALKDLQEALSLDPTRSASYGMLSAALRSSGHPEDALLRARQALALDPTYWYNWQGAHMALNDLGRYEEGLRYASKACELSRAQSACASIAIGLQKLRRAPEARTAARRAAELTPSIYGAYNLACYHALAGQRRDAIAFLQSAIKLGFNSVVIETDSDFSSLRGDPEFEEFVAEVKRKLRAP